MDQRGSDHDSSRIHENEKGPQNPPYSIPHRAHPGGENDQEKQAIPIPVSWHQAKQTYFRPGAC